MSAKLRVSTGAPLQLKRGGDVVALAGVEIGNPSALLEAVEVSWIWLVLCVGAGVCRSSQAFPASIHSRTAIRTMKMANIR